MLDSTFAALPPGLLSPGSAEGINRPIGADSGSATFLGQPSVSWSYR